MSDQTSTNEVSEVLKLPLFERLTDPILSRFVSFFVTWNWVSFVHLWVEKTADKKIEMFLETLSKTFVLSRVTGYPHWLGFIINGFVPLLLSLVWIYYWRNWTTKMRQTVFISEASIRHQKISAKAEEIREKEWATLTASKEALSEELNNVKTMWEKHRTSLVAVIAHASTLQDGETEALKVRDKIKNLIPDNLKISENEINGLGVAPNRVYEKFPITKP